LLAGMTLAASPAAAKEYQVKMLNKGSDGSLMVFEPAFIKAAPGDTVKFLATNKGHNAETIVGMQPAGTPNYKGKINEEIVVKLSKPGVYGYKCLPHLGMGMVGVIQVGNATNKGQAVAAAAKLPGLGKKRMIALLAKVR
jgi:pseudoazurin